MDKINLLSILSLSFYPLKIITNVDLGYKSSKFKLVNEYFPKPEFTSKEIDSGTLLTFDPVISEPIVSCYERNSSTDRFLYFEFNNFYELLKIGAISVIQWNR